MRTRTHPPDPLAHQLEPLFHLLLRLKHDREVRLDYEKLHQQCSLAIERCRFGLTGGFSFTGGRGTRSASSAAPGLRFSFTGGRGTRSASSAAPGLRSERAGLAQADVDDACFALVALIDELAMLRGGPLKDYWQERALLVRSFDAQFDGPGFFDRLRGLRGDKQRQPVLRVFYLCVLLGYRGKYARPGEGGLLDIEESCRSELQRSGAIPSELVLAPHAERPYEKLADARRHKLSVALWAALAVVSMLLYAGLRFALDYDTQALIDRVAVGG